MSPVAALAAARGSGSGSAALVRRAPRPEYRGWQAPAAWPATTAQLPEATRHCSVDLTPAAPLMVPPPAAEHPLADPGLSARLQRRAEEISSAFARIEPALQALAQQQFEPGFSARASAQLHAALGLAIPEAALRAQWSAPLDGGRLYARCVLGTFCRLVARDFDRNLLPSIDGESADDIVRRWGFHAIDISPCADGRLSGIVDYILRIPPALVAFCQSSAGARFAVEESLRHWEAVELRRWREGRPNDAAAPTRFLKIGVYHFSSLDPAHQGCAAHGSDTERAAGSLLHRLQQFAGAVEQVHCCGARVATLLVGVDTDTDAIRVHVPDASGAMDTQRFVDGAAVYAATLGLQREAAKERVRAAVTACAGVASDDAPSEGMRWFCAYLLKNNLAQVAAVRHWHGRSYADRGHTERLIVVGDPVDDVQLRNLAFQAQLNTVEEGAADLDVGMSILAQLHAPRRLAVPLLVHRRYDPRVPGAHERAQQRARRLQAAIELRYQDAVQRGALFVQAVVRAGMQSQLSLVEPALAAADCACPLPGGGRHAEAPA